jgi:hypothetical protein
MAKIYHPEDKHPQPYQEDLAPDASKGLNYGLEGPDLPTQDASNVKDLHELLSDFSAEELKQIPVQCAGNRLETGAVYLKLSAHQRYEFKAQGTEDVLDGDFIIAKKDVPFELWNRLVGIDDPARTKRAPK